MPASLLDLIKSRNFTEAHKTFQKVMEQKLQAALNEEKKCLTTEAHDEDWDDKDPDNANRGKRCLTCKGSINAKEETKFCSPSCQRKYKGVKEGASVFKCQECGKKFSREVDECPKCGSSDIDVLNESKASVNESVITESKFRIYYEDGTEEEFIGSASEVRKKVKDSKKAVDDVETIG